MGRPCCGTHASTGSRGSSRRIGGSRTDRGATDWLKVKCIDSEGFAIIGYEPLSVARGGLGRLLLACWAGDELVYAGSVGTGFTESVARALRRDLDALRTETPAIKLKEKRVVWTEPSLVAEVEFRGWTGDGKLRQASFKGLRDGADGARVFRR